MPFVMAAVPEVCRGRGLPGGGAGLLGDAVKRFHVFTLVPEAFGWFVDQHPVSTAIAAGAVSISVHDIRAVRASAPP